MGRPAAKPHITCTSSFPRTDQPIEESSENSRPLELRCSLHMGAPRT